VGDPRGSGVVQELFDGVVALDGVIGAENARLRRTEEPWQIRPAPDVVMCVDDHHSLAAARISFTTASVEAPLPIRSAR